MLQIEQLKKYFPPYLYDDPSLKKYIIKEYLQLLILDYLTTTPFLKKIVFIGGTNLNLVKGIDRFSEDLDFDCKDFPLEDFEKMSNDIVRFLRNSGYRVENKETKNDKLNEFRANLHFPELLFDMGLSGHRQARFLLKVECQDQQITYKTKMAAIKGCGMYFSFPVPEDEVLCAMKISALLSRQKGRDFYDTMFLMSQTSPDYCFLDERIGINDFQGLKSAMKSMLSKIDLKHKSKDFEHLVFEKHHSEKILAFESFIESL